MTSDRTQTLSVELEREDVETLLGFCERYYTGSGFRIEKKLRAALSQPEHQGDGEPHCTKCGSTQTTEESAAMFRICADCGHKYIAAGLRQPPAPVLSDEERERLMEIATALDEERLLASTQWTEDANFLRNLASREHRGEEGK